jgi:hypothetical protein
MDNLEQFGDMDWIDFSPLPGAPDPYHERRPGEHTRSAGRVYVTLRHALSLLNMRRLMDYA